METLIVNVQDSFMQDFLTIVEDNKEKIQIQKATPANLNVDILFDERKKQLKKLITDSENGTMEMLTTDEYNNEISTLFKKNEKRCKYLEQENI